MQLQLPMVMRRTHCAPRSCCVSREQLQLRQHRRQCPRGGSQEERLQRRATCDCRMRQLQHDRGCHSRTWTSCHMLHAGSSRECMCERLQWRCCWLPVPVQVPHCAVANSHSMQCREHAPIMANEDTSLTRQQPRVQANLHQEIARGRVWTKLPQLQGALVCSWHGSAQPGADAAGEPCGSCSVGELACSLCAPYALPSPLQTRGKIAPRAAGSSAANPTTAVGERVMRLNFRRGYAAVQQTSGAAATERAGGGGVQ